MIVSALYHGHQLPPSSALTSALNTDHDTVATLPTYTMHDTTLVAGMDKLSDVWLAQVVCCITNNGTPACTTASTRQRKVHPPNKPQPNIKPYILNAAMTNYNIMQSFF